MLLTFVIKFLRVNLQRFDIISILQQTFISLKIVFLYINIYYKKIFNLINLSINFNFLLII